MNRDIAPGPDDIRDCCEGSIPGVLATCAPDGTPNVSYLSQIEYLDAEHLALSFQFFNTTRRNILANPVARLLLIHPLTAAMFRVGLRYERTETSGPLFERMRAKLAGIASHEGMSGVFRLRGSDLYRITDIEAVPGQPMPAPARPASRLAALRRVSARLNAATDLAAAFDAVLDGLTEDFGIEHALLLMPDGSGTRLYAVGSRGYDDSGIGAEIPLGAGVVGIAAISRTPIRINFRAMEYSYGRAIREAALQGGLGDRLETQIPFPGLAEPNSQLAVPILSPGPAPALLGALYVESTHTMRFSYDDEDALVTLAAQLALAMRLLQAAEPAVIEDEIDERPPAIGAPIANGGPPLVVRHYAENHSVFLGDSYLIKGVAGSIFWTLIRDHAQTGRTGFSNRELRVDPRIGLPDLSDNLEARLILLQRRLVEYQASVRIEKTGRGRFRLCVQRPLQLVDIPA